MRGEGLCVGPAGAAVREGGPSFGLKRRVFFEGGF